MPGTCGSAAVSNRGECLPAPLEEGLERSCLRDRAVSPPHSQLPLIGSVTLAGPQPWTLSVKWD